MSPGNFKPLVKYIQCFLILPHFPVCTPHPLHYKSRITHIALLLKNPKCLIIVIQCFIQAITLIYINIGNIIQSDGNPTLIISFAKIVQGNTVIYFCRIQHTHIIIPYSYSIVIYGDAVQIINTKIENRCFAVICNGHPIIWKTRIHHSHIGIDMSQLFNIICLFKNFQCINLFLESQIVFAQKIMCQTHRITNFAHLIVIAQLFIQGEGLFIIGQCSFKLVVLIMSFSQIKESRGNYFLIINWLPQGKSLSCIQKRVGTIRFQIQFRQLVEDIGFFFTIKFRQIIFQAINLCLSQQTKGDKQ